jgi:hypothetical protein
MNFNDKLKYYLKYNKNTGIFIWKNKPNRNIKIGTCAGRILNTGYIIIGLDKKVYLAHRLAWYYVYGYFPENDVEHINQKKTDNRILNLREASHMCNLRNTGNFKHNKSGVKGVFWHKQTKRWGATIMVKQKNYDLGRYHNFYNAVYARLAAEQCLNWKNCEEKSPAYLFIQNLKEEKEPPKCRMTM